jgi:hypothetical protein
MNENTANIRSEFGRGKALTFEQKRKLANYFKGVNKLLLSAKERNFLVSNLREAYSRGNTLSNANRSFLLKHITDENRLNVLVGLSQKIANGNLSGSVLTKNNRLFLQQKSKRAKLQAMNWKGRFNRAVRQKYLPINTQNAQRADRKVFKSVANAIVNKMNESMRFLRADKYKESFASISKAKDMLDRAKKDFNKEISPYLKTIYTLTSVQSIKNAIRNSNAISKNRERVNYKGVLGGNSANSARSKIRRSMFGGYTLATIPKVRKMDIVILTYKNYAKRLELIADRLKVKKPVNAPKPPMAPKPAEAPAPKGPGFVNLVRNKYKTYQNARAAKKAQQKNNANVALAKKIKNKLSGLKEGIGSKANNYNVNYNNNSA